MNHELYGSVLLSKTEIRKEMNCIRSNDYKLHTCEVRKVALSSYDDKSYINNDGITTLAYHNVRIR